MASLSVRDLFRQARSSVSDPEDARYGDLDALVADGITCLFERMAESEVEQRVGVKLYERGPARQGHRNGYRKRSAQLSFTKVTMRRAIRPAICTQVTSTPLAVAMCSALRSFSSDALSSAALTKLPA